MGDCYVAAAGIPEARADHAQVMASFAARCLKEMTRVAHELEPILGPDTGDLQIRVGVHAGQVTAGVLRGLKGKPMANENGASSVFLQFLETSHCLFTH